MTVAFAAIIAGSTLVKLVAFALVAGLGVMGAFCAVIYCIDRAATLRQAQRRGAAAVFQAGSVLATATVVGIVVYGLILIASKPK